MADNKTKPTAGDPATYLATIDQPRRGDAEAVCAAMARITGEPPTMWGPSIVGFGANHYKYDSGREGSICKMGFSPRKAALTLYGMGIERNAAIVGRLGKHGTGKGCLHIKKLADVDTGVLDELIAAAWAG
ncbi:DUF1801 domain-containing protein [Sphingomonas sp.]|jgi:hypothetical protein|uniref:DUF1801 domain-containing protein n=1 Tax=Sphingomonas sp. TaxID=28214 RepID=UPI002E30D4F7|nr:DUF1801 domain-containing protein [Sphingomonas sp.]HEX4695737.1 DUF1801 domain-containing protein [Sphingomonas sp.]